MKVEVLEGERSFSKQGSVNVESLVSYATLLGWYKNALMPNVVYNMRLHELQDHAIEYTSYRALLLAGAEHNSKLYVRPRATSTRHRLLLFSFRRTRHCWSLLILNSLLLSTPKLSFVSTRPSLLHFHGRLFVCLVCLMRSDPIPSLQLAPRNALGSRAESIWQV